MTRTRDIFGVPMYPLFGVVTAFFERRHHNFWWLARLTYTIFFGSALDVKENNWAGES
jgi:hypothetical protein